MWRFDQDLDSIKTYLASTIYARCEVITANDMVTVLHDYYSIDILHFYPPCPIFSPAYACFGRNDESSEAPLLATEELLKKIRPRIMTLEDTFGPFRALDNLPRLK